MKILNLYIPIPTPAIWLLPSKKKKTQKKLLSDPSLCGFSLWNHSEIRERS